MEESVRLNALDRCDGCGAQAYTAARRDGQELLFCKHHLAKSADKLLDQGWAIIHDYIALGELADNENIVYS